MPYRYDIYVPIAQFRTELFLHRTVSPSIFSPPPFLIFVPKSSHPFSSALVLSSSPSWLIVESSFVLLVSLSPSFLPFSPFSPFRFQKRHPGNFTKLALSRFSPCPPRTYRRTLPKYDSSFVFIFPTVTRRPAFPPFFVDEIFISSPYLRREVPPPTRFLSPALRNRAFARRTFSVATSPRLSSTRSFFRLFNFFQNHDILEIREI